MQLMINTNEETRETLLLASRFLAEHAQLLPAADATPVRCNGTNCGSTTAGLHSAECFAEHEERTSINGPGNKIELTDGTRIDLTPGATVSHASVGDMSETRVTVPAGTSGSNILPFVVPPAPANTVANAASTSPAAPSAGAVGTAASVTVEYDSAGLSHDARIHQEGRGKKKDGTWMLKRRVDAKLVEEVTKELLARKGTPNTTLGAPPPPAGFVPPPGPGMTTVNAPMPPPLDPTAAFGPAPGGAPAAAAAVPLPGGPVVEAHGVPGAVFVPPPGPMAGLPPPPASVPVSQMPTGAASAPNPLRDFVMKCSRLTSSGMITKEQQDAALQSAGIPSMQSLPTMQHLIPQADYFISKAAGLVA